MDFDAHPNDADLITWFEENDTPETSIVFDFLYHDIYIETAVARLIKHFRDQETYGLLLDNMKKGPAYTIHQIFFQFLGNVIIPGVERFRETHEPYISLLKALKACLGKKPFECMLQNALDSKWRRYAASYPDYPDRAQDQSLWTCLNVFVARAHASSLQDLSSYAVDTFDMTWRSGGWRLKRPLPGRGDNYELVTTDDVRVVEEYAPAAAAVISVCGKRLYSESKEARGKWGQWKSCIEWIIQHQELTGDVRAQCRRTLEKMTHFGA